MAQVVNVSTAMPSTGQTFGLDTNVLLWLGYSRATLVPGQYRPYTTFVNRAKNSGARLVRNPLTLVEASHRIEMTEYKLAHPGRPFSEVKDFRSVAANRDRVAGEIQLFWDTIIELTDPLSVAINEPLATTVISKYREASIGPYDISIVATFLAGGVVAIVSDDHDVATYGSELFHLTAHRDVLATACDTVGLKQLSDLSTR